MREIKFRARDRNNKWVYGTGIVQVEYNTYDTSKWELVQKVNYDELDNYYPSYETEEIDIKTLGQYTGLKDKNGKEIYEGDIIQHWYDYSDFKDRYLVEYDVDELRYVFQNLLNKNNFIALEDLYDEDYGDYSIEVIGNIYENPELLEDKE